MPVSDGVGYNPKTTPYKQLALRNIAGHLLGSSIRVAMGDDKRPAAPCFICDMTAGPGLVNGTEGSPLILAGYLSNLVKQFRYPATLICVERNKLHLAHLQAVMANRYPELHINYFRDQAEALSIIPAKAVGLTYWDPNNYSAPRKGLDADLLRQFGRSHYRMDILMTRECGAFWRMINAAHCQDALSPQDYMALTGKRHQYVKMYANWQWWTFCFASNWEGRSIKKLQMHNVLSREGQKILARWTPDIEVTPDEAPAQQGALPWAM